MSAAARLTLLMLGSLLGATTAIILSLPAVTS